MAKDLERDLGLASVMAISIGAMVGSGIFILPALAMKMAGPGVVLAYLLAGLLVLPAALSKSEMATAMPEAGGTYVYIERGMGPLLGTIAGIGTWFSLSFKGALALVGGAPYIILLFDLPVQPVALGIAVVLVVVNLLGAKQTGRLQVLIVTVMLAALVWFIGGSAGTIHSTGYGDMFEKGIGGILAATGFVYVSYAGVTKVASVAEEVEDPGRIIPIGMLGSLAFTTLLYVLVVSVIVWAAPGDITGSVTPVADVAEATMATVGVVAVVLAAILALISTANAGLLSSSRYPFAMSRDHLAPRALEHVSDRFDTPTTAITVTGILMLVLIAFVPIGDIAKLGSAFKIVVFVLVNLALVAFRESDFEDYDPEFEDPLYPWTQTVGVLGGLVLLTQMGAVPLGGAVLFVIVGILWYLGYARGRVRREGVARDEIRRRIGRQAVERTRATVADGGEGTEVLVAVTEDTDPAREAALVRLAADVARQRDGYVTAVRFDEVPDQLPLDPAAEKLSTGDEAFERRIEAVVDDLQVPVEYGEIVSHDTRHAVVNFAEKHEADLLVLEAARGGFGRGLFQDEDWITRHVPTDVLLVDATDVGSLEELAMVTDTGPFDPFKVEVADALASGAGAEITLVHALPEGATDEQRATMADYHGELADLCTAPVASRLIAADDPGALSDAVATADLIVVEGQGSWLGGLFDPSSSRLLDETGGASVVVHPHRTRRPGLVRRLLERVTF